MTAFLADGKCRREVAGLPVVVISTGNGVVVIENRCPHQQAQLFHEGLVEEGMITCPLHGRTFRLDDGACMNGAGRLTILESSIVDGELMVKPVPGPEYGLFR